MRCAQTVLLIFGLLIAQRAHAQTSIPATQGEASVYLLRIERESHLQSVCVLLKADGQYHLERHTTQKVRVLEGSIDANELRDVIRIVSDDRLYDLEQKQIPDLMMKADDDHLVLDIHRPGAWQQLFFPDSASREPFHETVGALVVGVGDLGADLLDPSDAIEAGVRDDGERHWDELPRHEAQP